MVTDGLSALNRQPSFASLPLVRAVARLGPVRLLRMLLLIILIGSIAQTLSESRPDLSRPSDLGTDPSTYLAAAQRLVQSHEIYSLEPGDRPVPHDNAPFWTAPLLSPPGIAVLWAPLATLVSPSAASYIWWVFGIIAATGYGVFLILCGRPIALVIAMPLLYQLGTIAVSGNLNTFLLVGTAGIWFLTGRSSRRDGVAGFAVAMMSWLKLTPIALLWWLVL